MSRCRPLACLPDYFCTHAGALQLTVVLYVATQIIASLLQPNGQPWQWGWSVLSGSGDNIESAQLFAISTWPAELAESLKECALATSVQHLPIGAAVSAVGSPFGIIAPRVFGSNVRHGRVSAQIPSSLPSGRQNNQASASKEDELLAVGQCRPENVALYIVDVKLIPGEHITSPAACTALHGLLRCCYIIILALYVLYYTA
jgi:hypothetical protein